MPEVLERNIYVADKAEQRIVRSSAEVEREIWRLIQEVLNDFDTKGGKFVSDETVKQLLASLNKKLRGLIEETKFYDNISEFLHDFDQIEANLKAAHQSLNDITIANKVLSSQKDWAIENTTRFLRQAQINVKFIEPVKRALYTRVNYGASVTKTEEYLRQMILGTDKKNGILTRWVGQVARDTINQYEGVINQQIKVTYDMNATRYVGPILLDSRAQCVRWVGMGIIPDSSLESELEWARKNGAGLIPETDVSNFCIYRGGYNCVHTSYPAFMPKRKTTKSNTEQAAKEEIPVTKEEKKQSIPLTSAELIAVAKMQDVFQKYGTTKTRDLYDKTDDKTYIEIKKAFESIKEKYQEVFEAFDELPNHGGTFPKDWVWKSEFQRNMWTATVQKRDYPVYRADSFASSKANKKGDIVDFSGRPYDVTDQPHFASIYASEKDRSLFEIKKPLTQMRVRGGFTGSVEYISGNYVVVGVRKEKILNYKGEMEEFTVYSLEQLNTGEYITP